MNDEKSAAVQDEDGSEEERKEEFQVRAKWFWLRKT
jgi:hypothetical protein